MSQPLIVDAREIQWPDLLEELRELDRLPPRDRMPAFLTLGQAAGILLRAGQEAGYHDLALPWDEEEEGAAAGADDPHETDYTVVGLYTAHADPFVLTVAAPSPEEAAIRATLRQAPPGFVQPDHVRVVAVLAGSQTALTTRWDSEKMAYLEAVARQRHREETRGEIQTACGAFFLIPLLDHLAQCASCRCQWLGDHPALAFCGPFADEALPRHLAQCDLCRDQLCATW